MTRQNILDHQFVNDAYEECYMGFYSCYKHHTLETQTQYFDS